MKNIVIYGTLIMEIIFFLLLGLQAPALFVLLAWLLIISGAISLFVLDVKEIIKSI